MAGNRTADRVAELVKKSVEDLGLKLWDVRFVKEGASWYLRIFIDKEGGVDINDCADVSHAVDPILDEADPIDVSYYLEVCSPGLGRELRCEEHYRAFIGSEINISLYKEENGTKSFRGILKDYTEGPVLEIDGVTRSFKSSAVSKAKLCDDE